MEKPIRIVYMLGKTRLSCVSKLEKPYKVDIWKNPSNIIRINWENHNKIIKYNGKTRQQDS
jgi:hypothetical protein